MENIEKHLLDITREWDLPVGAHKSYFGWVNVSRDSDGAINYFWSSGRDFHDPLCGHGAVSVTICPDEVFVCKSAITMHHVTDDNSRLGLVVFMSFRVSDVIKRNQQAERRRGFWKRVLRFLNL